MNKRSYQRLIPVILPLVLAACEDRPQEPEGTLPSLEGPITDPVAPSTEPAAPGAQTPPPSTPPSDQ